MQQKTKVVNRIPSFECESNDNLLDGKADFDESEFYSARPRDWYGMGINMILPLKLRK